MKLTIKRSEWLHGEGGSSSRLLRSSDNKKCCLGFLGQQLGIADAYLRAQYLPSHSKNKWPEWIFDNRDSHLSDLIQANDSLRFENREQRIIELFAERDVQVEFVG